MKRCFIVVLLVLSVTCFVLFAFYERWTDKGVHGVNIGWPTPWYMFHETFGDQLSKRTEIDGSSWSVGFGVIGMLCLISASKFSLTNHTGSIPRKG